MGSLKNHDVGSLVEKHGLLAFVETGLYLGEGLAHAQTFPQFEKLVSLDIHVKWIVEGQEKFNDPRITLLIGSSLDVLPKVLELVGDRPVLWWLDAHLPELSTEKHFDRKREPQGNKVFDDNTTFPMQGELEIITTRRDFARDVFLMDDLRMYENDSFGWGSWKHRDKYNPGNSDFVETLLGETHTITRGLEEHGFLVAVPKENRNAEK